MQNQILCLRINTQTAAISKIFSSIFLGGRFQDFSRVSAHGGVASNSRQSGLNAKPRRIALILDWDDTLFPTTLLKQLLGETYVGTPDGIRKAPMRKGMGSNHLLEVFVANAKQ